VHRPATLTLRLPRRRSRAAASLAAALIAVTSGAVLGACSTQSPSQTQVPYLPSDGIPATIGAVEARNLLVIAASKGATGVLSGSLINTSAQPVSITFTTVADAQAGGTGGSTVQLAAGRQQQISGVQFPDLQASPGAMTVIVLKTTAGQQNVDVPVLLPDGVYSTVTATAGPTTATTTTAASAAATAANTDTAAATTGAAAGGTTSPAAGGTATATTSSSGG
jgi:hypothetical protein